MIHPVILCGGNGTRLWPLSSIALPKPFLRLMGGKTLFEAVLARVADRAVFAAPIIVAGAAHVDLLTRLLGDTAGVRLVIEPAAKNTAPAIALAAALLPPEAVMVVCPSDHHIADAKAFQSAALSAATLAQGGHLVSFGIAPHRAETSYGYLERGQPLAGGYRVGRFVEKPDLATAQAYLASGNYSWNGGIFAFRAGQLLEELAAHRPAMAQLVATAVAQGHGDAACFYPAAVPFSAIEGDSIDYAVMENTVHAAMVPVDMGWSDVGNWAALADSLGDQADAAGNFSSGGAVDLDDCSGVLALTDGPRISAVGLTDICIVVSKGEVLVTSRDGAPAVGNLPGAVNQ